MKNIEILQLREKAKAAASRPQSKALRAFIKP